MAEYEINGVKLNLEQLKSMTQEDISRLKQQNIVIQEQINDYREILESGSFQDDTRKGTIKNYNQIIYDIGRLTNVIEKNQEIIEMSVEARIERGDFSSLGIKNIEDFIKATQTTIDISKEIDQKQIDEAQELLEKVDGIDKLYTLNMLIKEKITNEDAIVQNEKRIKEIDDEIKKIDDEIAKLDESLKDMPDEERIEVRKKIQDLKFRQTELSIEKLDLQEKNVDYKKNIQDINKQLRENNIDENNNDDLMKIYNQNQEEIDNVTKPIQVILNRNNVNCPQGETGFKWGLQEVIDINKAKIEKADERKEKLSQTQSQIKPQAENIKIDNQINKNVNQKSNMQTNLNQSNNLPMNVSDSLLFKKLANLFNKAKDRINNFIDKINPKLREQRIEFLSELHPNWNEETIESIASERSKELNDLIKSGITPEVYAISQNNKDNVKDSAINQNKNIISEAARNFDRLMKMEADVPENMKKEFNGYMSRIKESVNGKQQPKDKGENKGKDQKKDKGKDIGDDR